MPVSLQSQIGGKQQADQALAESISSKIRVAIPGVIQSFDPDAVTCVVLPAVKGEETDSDGKRVPLDLPLLVDVPVIFPRGGGVTLTFPVKAGDECLVVFADCGIDFWWQNGGVQEPVSDRQHHLADGFAFVGPQSQAKKISGISTTAAQLRTDDGAAFIELDPGSYAVNVTTTGKLTASALGGTEINSPEIVLNGNVTINGNLAQGMGEGGGTATILGPVNVTNDVTAGGITGPEYQTILNTLTGFFQQIYGDDVYLEPDSKDGQMLAIYALAIHDANNTSIAVYNSFSPATAQHGALASNVKINGISVNPASRSTADVLIVGQVGRQITNGVVRDGNGISWSLPGVERYRPYENDTNVTDANGLPAHSISIVVDGDDAAAIAQTITTKKTPGGTFGTTTIPVADNYGIVHPISFFRPTTVNIFVEVQIKALQGYTSAIGEEIRVAIADYINAIRIGDPVFITRLFLLANLNGSVDSANYDVIDLQIGRSAGSLAPANIIVGFNEAAACSAGNVVLVVTS